MQRVMHRSMTIRNSHRTRYVHVPHSWTDGDPPPSYRSLSTAALGSPSTLCSWGRTDSGWEAQEGVNRISGSVQWPAHPFLLRRSTNSHQARSQGSLTRSCSCFDENNGCYAQVALKKWHRHVLLPSYKKYKNTHNTPNFIWMYLLI